MTQHSFQAVGEQLKASLLKTADDILTEAKNLSDSVKTLTEGIDAQLAEHARLLNDMDVRIRTFGEGVLSAHKQYINGHSKPQQGEQIHENPSP
jgi:hypothetical protein